MADAPASALDVVGQLSILADDAPIDVEFRGDTIVVTVPDLATGSRIVRRLPLRDRRAWGNRLAAILARAGLEVQVWVGDRQVAGLKPGASQGLVARWLGVGPLDIRFRAILASLFRRSSTGIRSGEAQGPG